MKTKYGRFTQDFSGLWHYTTEAAGVHISVAAQDALEKYAGMGIAWFWFNDTPAPIYVSDNNTETLLGRWEEWRKSYQDGKLLHQLLELANSGHLGEVNHV